MAEAEDLKSSQYGFESRLTHSGDLRVLGSGDPEPLLWALWHPRKLRRTPPASQYLLPREIAVWPTPPPTWIRYSSGHAP